MRRNHQAGLPDKVICFPQKTVSCTVFHACCLHFSSDQQFCKGRTHVTRGFRQNLVSIRRNLQLPLNSISRALSSTERTPKPSLLPLPHRKAGFAGGCPNTWWFEGRRHGGYLSFYDLVTWAKPRVAHCPSLIGTRGFQGKGLLGLHQTIPRSTGRLGHTSKTYMIEVHYFIRLKLSSISWKQESHIFRHGKWAPNVLNNFPKVMARTSWPRSLHCLSSLPPVLLRWPNTS